MKTVEWWKKCVIYQIYPRSFRDSNGDGVGDIIGILQSLDYLEWLGIKAVWLSPIYRSPMKDFGYDVSDYCDIDPIFGKLDDLRTLLDEMHKRGMYLIMDFIPNHTSDAHQWFQKSEAKEHGFEDWYVWRDGGRDAEDKPIPPNNWESYFRGSAWTWSPAREQFYLHHFLPQQPDLNYRCPDVRSAMAHVLRFWLDFGVDGFRADAVDCLVEDKEYPDKTEGEECPYEGRPGTFEVIAEWTKLIAEWGEKNDKSVFFTTEAYCKPDGAKRYYRRTVDNQLVGILGEEADWWPNWVMGNHDQPRVVSRLGSGGRLDRVALTLLLTLPGTPTHYYADELGLGNVEVPEADRVDCDDRDRCRAPMPWNDGPNAGFSSAKPWLPLNSEASDRNVEAQTQDPHSCLHLFRRLVDLKQNHAIFSQNNGRNIITLESGLEEVFIFLRISQSMLNPFAYLIILNLSEEAVKLPNFEISLGPGLSLNSGKLLLNSERPGDPEVPTSQSFDSPFRSLRLNPAQALLYLLGPLPFLPNPHPWLCRFARVTECSVS